MDTFSVPFRFINSGQAAKHPEGSDEYYLHILSACLQTEPGELALDATFGTNDPTFQKINKASIVEIASKYVPELSINKVSAFSSDDGSEEILISYDTSTIGAQQ